MASTICMVLQLGFAIILVLLFSSEAFISGTINGMLSSIRQAELLSITNVPAAANRGAYSFDTDAPAEKIATSGFMAMASVMLTILRGILLKNKSLPTDFSEATGMISVILSKGMYRASSSTLIITLPTRPVAPTIAIFIYPDLVLFLQRNLILNIDSDAVLWLRNINLLSLRKFYFRGAKILHLV